jgi:hypothetical protein
MSSQLEAFLYVVRKLRTLVGLGQWMRVHDEINGLRETQEQISRESLSKGNASKNL